MIKRILVRNFEEEERMMHLLADYDYHWVSGQSADNIPYFLRLKPMKSPEAKNMVITCDLKRKKISFIAAELLSTRELEALLSHAVSLEEACTFIQLMSERKEGIE